MILAAILGILALIFGGDVSKDPPHQDAVKRRRR